MEAVSKEPSISDARILAGIADEAAWLASIERDYEVFLAEDADAVADALLSDPYDILLLDDRLVSDEEIIAFVQEIKRRFPALSLCVLSDDTDQTYLDTLVSHGAADILASDVHADVLRRHLRVMERQRDQNVTWSQHMQQFHTIALLARQLHGASRAEALVLQTIQTLCSNFDLSGVVIALEEGDTYHIYAGRDTTDDAHQIFETFSSLHNYDPLAQVTQSNSPRLLGDLSRTNFYAVIPPLQEATSAVVVPLNYGDQIRGALALARTDQPFQQNDVVPFELIAGHFAIAYRNIAEFYIQEAKSRSAEEMLDAWQRMSHHFDVEDIINELVAKIGSLSTVKHTAVFLFDPVSEEKSLLLRGTRSALPDALRNLDNAGKLEGYLNDFDKRMTPMAFSVGRNQNNPLYELSHLMESRQIMLVPIAGTMMMGGIFVSSINNRQFSMQDTTLIEGVARAASQTIERNTFIGEMQLQTGRLESLMRRIRDGLFFVDDNGRVIFSNPQLSELTSLEPSAIQGATAEQLIERLANAARGSQQAQQEMLAAVDQALSGDDDEDTYPIVDLYIEELGTDIAVEFSRIQQVDTPGETWVGFVRAGNAPSRHRNGNSADASPLLDALVDHLSLPYLQLRQSVRTLIESHDRLRGMARRRLIQQLAEQVEEANSLWTNFTHLYDLQNADYTLRPTVMEPHEIIEFALQTPDIDNMQRDITFNPRPPHFSIQADEEMFQHIVTRLLHGMEHLSNGSRTPLELQLLYSDAGGQVIMRDRHTAPQHDFIDEALSALNTGEVTEEDLDYLDLHLGKLAADAMNGTLTIDANATTGLQLTLTFPVVDADAQPISSTAPEAGDGRASAPSSAKSSLRIIVLESRSRLLSQYFGYLETEGHEIIRERSIRDALLTMSIAQIDLIVLESDSTADDIAAACEKLRQKTEVPITILAQHDSRQMFINAMDKGADDYLVLPITGEEMAVRLKRLARRKDISNVLQPPLQMGDLFIDFSRRRVFLDNDQLDLTTKEYALLCELAKHGGKVLTHEELLKRVWGTEYRDEKQYLWVNVSRLRKKLEPQKDSPRYLQTEKGVGYRLSAPDDV